MELVGIAGRELLWEAARVLHTSFVLTEKMRSKSSWKDSTLYKYRCWTNDYHKALLTKNEIYFSSIDEINDPYDCKIPLRYDLLTDEEWRSHVEAYLRSKYFRWNDSVIDELVDEFIQKGQHRDPENQAAITKQQEEYRRKQFGMFSTSLVRDNVMMWSHYSDSHQGFCVGYDQKLLMGFLAGISHSLHFFHPPIKVTYVPRLPKLIPNLFSFEDHVLQPLESKWNIWRYEKEVRIFLFHYEDLLSKATKTVTLPEGLVSEVILGSEASEQTKQEIIEVLRQRSDSIPLFQVARKPNEFKLVCAPVNY